jgi:hypothetical protein
MLRNAVSFAFTVAAQQMKIQIFTINVILMRISHEIIQIVKLIKTQKRGETILVPNRVTICF